jgi:hypothetical protein
VPPRRIRRPLLALIILVAVLVAGYIWQATRSDALPVTRSSASVAAGRAPFPLAAREN